MDRSTVYRVLADLTDAGLLEQVRLGDGIARFEIQEVAHHHAVCTRCGDTEDVSEDAVRALSTRMRRESGFLLGHHPLLFPGLCAACASSRRLSAREPASSPGGSRPGTSRSLRSSM